MYTHPHAVFGVILEDILLFYSCCNIRHGAVVDRIGIYADLLKQREGLVENTICGPVSDSTAGP